MYGPYEHKPFLFTREVLKNGKASGLRSSLLHQSAAASELWDQREALKVELEATKARLALCEKVILESVLSKTPPTP